MKILYFGTVCDLKAFDFRYKDCNEIPSVAPIVFETALMDGFHKNNADIEIYSYPMMPRFPDYRLFVLGSNSELLPCGYRCNWLNTVNFPVLKQYFSRLSARRVLKRWLDNNAKEAVIMTYSVPPFMVRDILAYAKKYHVKTVAIIPDLVRDMYINENKHSFMYRLKQLYLKPALRHQGDYDGYVYLTDRMSSVVAPDKPYIVMEGIADVSNISLHGAQEKATPRSIMYAGMLHKKYGIINLLNAFEKLNLPDTQLWLFGEGTAVQEIKEREGANSAIRYFGSVSREQILAYERQATLLVNPRDPTEEFTQFSFPSKTIEYMLSGTPLVTTKLKGIPEEYFDFVFTAESNDVDDLTESMRRALSCSEQSLREIGIRAQEFIKSKKNSFQQAKKILDFLEDLNYDSKN